MVILLLVRNLMVIIGIMNEAQYHGRPADRNANFLKMVGVQLPIKSRMHNKQELGNMARLASHLYFLVDTELNSSANSNDELFLVYGCQHLITSITQCKLLLSSPSCHVMIQGYRTAHHSLPEGRPLAFTRL